MTVVLLAGYGRDPARLNLGPLASNIVLQSYTPIADLLPMADALVTNGNSDSAMAALAAGLPLVVLPSLWDQAELAWRVEETGVGLRLPPRSASPAGMQRAVKRVLQDERFGQRAIAMGGDLVRQGGAERAAGLIAELTSAVHSDAMLAAAE